MASVDKLVGHFVGLTIPETASALGISESTVEREWRFLRTVLQEALDPEENRS